MVLTSFQQKDHLDDNFPVQGSPSCMGEAKF